MKVIATRESYDKKVDFPTSGSPSRRTVTSGGGSVGSYIFGWLRPHRQLQTQGGFIFAFCDGVEVLERRR